MSRRITKPNQKMRNEDNMSTSNSKRKSKTVNFGTHTSNHKSIIGNKSNRKETKITSSNEDVIPRKTAKKKVVNTKQVDSCIDDHRKNNHGCCNDDIDEIQVMIRNMCDHAFQRDFQEEKEKGIGDADNNSTCDDSDGNAADESNRRKECARKTKSLDENNRVGRLFQYKYNAHNTQSYQLLLNDKELFINHQETQANQDRNQNIAFIYKLKQDVEFLVNHHYLKSLRKKEKKMHCKFDNAKKQIFDCIQVLQLHHDELSRKERQYFEKLENYRTFICSEAQDHCNNEIQKVLNTNTPFIESEQ